MVRTSLALVVFMAGCGVPPELAPPVPDGPAALGKTLTACPGGTYATIKSAITAAVSGDVVEVCPGTYAERLTITGKTLTLRSTGGSGATTIDATSGGRAIRVDGGAIVTIEGFTIRNGTAALSTGGDVYCKDATLTLIDNVIEDGFANLGGGLGMSNCSGVVEGNTFRDNEAVLEGGGLWADGSIDVLDNTFEANHSQESGGAAFLEGSFADIAGNTVLANTSIDGGAGIYVSDGAPFVDGNHFELNDSDDEGGGLRVKLAEATITDNTFVENHADYRGGAAKISHDEVVLSGNTYIGNTAWVYGGALFMFESASDLTFEHFEGNESDYGGAIANQAGWGGVDIYDSTFIDNEAENGGHIWNDLVGKTLRTRRVDMIGGSADYGGAVYAITGSVIHLEATLFEGNDATVAGGALHLDGVSGTVTNDVFMWNTSPDASALKIVNGATLTVRNTIFRENTTGATIDVDSGTVPAVRYSDFYQNTINFSGIGNQVGLNGNLAVSPGFVDAADGDYHLLTTSAVKDKGDPGIKDTNGTRSDMGVYGGPQGY